MRRFVCPGCEKPLRVRDDLVAKAVRCPACGARVPLAVPDAAEAKTPRGVGRASLASKSNTARPAAAARPAARKEGRRAPAEDDEDRPARPRARKGTRWHSLGTKWHGLLFLALEVVLGLLLGLVALVFPRAGGGVLAVVGMTAGFLGVVMVIVGAWHKGLWDDMNSLPYLVRRMPIVWLFYLFRYTVAYPKVLACWMVLSVLGFVFAAAGGLVADRPDGAPWAVGRPPANGSPSAAVGQPPAGAGDDVNNLLAEMNDATTPAGRLAIQKLAAITPDEHRVAVAQKLAALANAPDPVTRSSVLRALSVWATPVEVPLLIDVLNGPDVSMRQVVLENVGKLKDERLLGPLVRLLQDPISRGGAETALKDMGPMAEKAVLPLLQGGSGMGFDRLAVIAILKDGGTQYSVPALEATANGADVTLRGPANMALAAISARTPH